MKKSTNETLNTINQLVLLHQEIIDKLNASPDNVKLETAFDMVTEKLDKLDAVLAEELSNERPVKLNEGEYGEGWMIKSQLHAIARDAMKLYKMINEKEDFEDWVQAKLTIVHDYMMTLTHFIEYRKKTVGDFDMDDSDQYKTHSDR